MAGILTRFADYLGNFTERFSERWHRGRTKGMADTAAAKPRKPRSTGEAAFSSMLMGGSGYGWPGAWSSDRLEQANHYKHFIYLGINAIKREFCRQKPNVALVRPAGPQQFQKGIPSAIQRRRYEYSLKSIEPHEEIIPISETHPLCQKLRRPNVVDTGADLFGELILFLYLTGNSYMWVVPSKLGIMDGTGKPAELWVVPSHWVWPRIGKHQLIEYYEIRPWIGTGSAGIIFLPPEEVIHFRFKSPIHKVDGYSPLVAGAEWVDSAESIDRARFFTFKNGSFTLGALELGEKYADPDDYDIDRINAKFIQRYQGENNAGKVFITPPGSKLVPLTITPEEMAFVTSFDQMRDAVLSLMQVPKEVVGVAPSGNDLSWYAPLQQFCRYTIAPLYQMVAEGLTMHLASRYDDPRQPAQAKHRIWWDDPTPENPAQLNSDITTDFQCRAITPDEIRALRGREALPEGIGKYPIAPVGEGPMGGGEDLGMSFPMPGAGLGHAPAVPPGKRFEKATWSESDHPRADDGKFGSGSGSSGRNEDKPVGDKKIAEKVDLSLADEDSKKTILDTAQRVLGEHGVRLNEIRVADKSGEMLAGHSPGYIVVGTEALSKKPLTAEQLAKNKAHNERYADSLMPKIEELEGQIKEAKGAKKQKLKRQLNELQREFLAHKLAPSTYVWEATKNPLEAIVAHEAGHAIDAKEGFDFAKAVGNLKDEGKFDSEDWYKLSLYASSHPSEMVAEIVAAIYSGQEDKVPKSLLMAYNRAIVDANKTKSGWPSRCKHVTKLAGPAALIEVPDIAQPDHYSCGACAAMSVGRYFGVGPEDLDGWKSALGTSEEESTHPTAIVEYLKSMGLQVMARDGMTVDDLRSCWRANQPVIVCVQDYGPRVPDRAQFAYGHYLVVIGVDYGFVFVQDSSADNVVGDNESIQAPGRIMIEESVFEKSWHDVDASGTQYVRYGIAVGAPVQSKHHANGHARGLPALS